MSFFVIKFKNRLAQDVSNKYLSEIYTNGPKFDIDLLASDNSIISAHKFVVFMFSNYLKDYLLEVKPKGKTCVPLPGFSKFVLQHVIDLFYNGQIVVGAEVKPRIEKALQFLQVEDFVVQNPDKKPINSGITNTVPGKSHSEYGAIVQQSNQQALKRELSSNCIQHNMQPPIKRPRPQSMCVEPSSRVPGGMSNELLITKPGGQRFLAGSKTITKTKVTPSSEPPTTAQSGMQGQFKVPHMKYG